MEDLNAPSSGSFEGTRSTSDGAVEWGIEKTSSKALLEEVTIGVCYESED